MKTADIDLSKLLEYRQQEDTGTELIRVVQAARLIGAHCVVTEGSAGVARLLIEIGADLSSIKTLENLEQGLRA